MCRRQRRRLLVETNRAYTALRADKRAWADLQAERRLWDTMTSDGLDE